jgi:hypothetical protein
MKMPKGDIGKRSLPGEFSVIRENGLPKVYPLESRLKGDELYVVYDNGKVCVWDDFTTIRERVRVQWTQSPLTFDPISSQLKSKINEVETAQKLVNASVSE